MVSKLLKSFFAIAMAVAMMFSLNACFGVSEAKLEEIRKESYELGCRDGYDDGYSDGYNDGYEVCEDELHSGIQQIADMSWAAEDIINEYYAGCFTLKDIAEMNEEMGIIAQRMLERNVGDVDFYSYLTGENIE